MQHPLHASGDALGKTSDERLDFGAGDLLALPALLVLCVFFFLVGVWDKVHEAVITWGERDA